MAISRLARKIAEQIGRSADEVQRLIDQVGEGRVREMFRVSDDSAQASDDAVSASIRGVGDTGTTVINRGGSTTSSWFTGPKARTAATLGIIGGGSAGTYQYYQSQEADAAADEQDADTEDTMAAQEVIEMLLDMDVSPSKRRELVAQYLNSRTDDDPDPDDDGPLSDLFGDDLKVLLGLLIVLVLIVQLDLSNLQVGDN